MTWTVNAALTPPEPVSTLALCGAAALLVDVAEDLASFDSLVRSSSEERAAIEVRGVEDDASTAAAVWETWIGAFEALVARTPDLHRWALRVDVYANNGDDDGDTDDTDGVHAGDGHIGGNARALTPDDLAAHLSDDLDHVESIRRAAEDFAALPRNTLTFLSYESPDPAEKAQAHAHAQNLAGCLIYAASIVTDQLFDDINELTRAHEEDRSADIEQTWVLSALPPRFRHHYTPVFARRLLVAFVDVTRRLTAPWQPVACIAQELCVHVLLDQVEVVAEIAGLELEDGWRDLVQDLILDDLDQEMLYDPALDGFEDGPAPLVGISSMAFDDWFVPFDNGRHVPLYCVPEPPPNGDPPSQR